MFSSYGRRSNKLLICRESSNKGLQEHHWSYDFDIRTFWTTLNPFETGGLKSPKHRSLGTTYMFKAIVNHLKLGSKGWKFLGWFHLQSSLIDVILGHQPLSRSIWEQFYFYTYIHVFRLLGPQQVSFGRISTYLGQVFRPSEYTLLA